MSWQKRHFADGVIGLRCLAAGTVLSQFADDKFLKKIGDGGCAYADQRVFKSESHSIAIFGRVVDIGNSASREASDEASQRSPDEASLPLKPEFFESDPDQQRTGGGRSVAPPGRDSGRDHRQP